MRVSIDSTTDVTEVVESFGMTVVDKEPDLNLYIVEVPTESSKSVLLKLSTTHGWYVRWNWEEEFAGTVASVFKSFIKKSEKERDDA